MKNLIAKLKAKRMRFIRPKALLSLLCALAALAGIFSVLRPVEPTAASDIIIISDVITVTPGDILDISDMKFETQKFQSYFDYAWTDYPSYVSYSSIWSETGASGYYNNDVPNPDHIIAYPRTDTTPPRLGFYGYAEKPHFDAVYTEKYNLLNWDFDFDSAGWDTHCFKRTGFFVKSTMNPDGTITGYLVSIGWDSPDQSANGAFNYSLYYVENMDIDEYNSNWFQGEPVVGLPGLGCTVTLLDSWNPTSANFQSLLPGFRAYIDSLNDYNNMYQGWLYGYEVGYPVYVTEEPEEPPELQTSAPWAQYWADFWLYNQVYQMWQYSQPWPLGPVLGYPYELGEIIAEEPEAPELPVDPWDQYAVAVMEYYTQFHYWNTGNWYGDWYDYDYVTSQTGDAYGWYYERVYGAMTEEPTPPEPPEGEEPEWLADFLAQWNERYGPVNQHFEAVMTYINMYMSWLTGQSYWVYGYITEEPDPPAWPANPLSKYFAELYMYTRAYYFWNNGWAWSNSGAFLYEYGSQITEKPEPPELPTDPWVRYYAELLEYEMQRERWANGWWNSSPTVFQFMWLSWYEYGYVWDLENGYMSQEPVPPEMPEGEPPAWAPKQFNWEPKEGWQGSAHDLSPSSPKAHFRFDLEEDKITLWMTWDSDNPLSEPMELLSYTLDENEDWPGIGFGLFTHYASHGCSQLTVIEYSDFMLEQIITEVPVKAEALFKLLGTETEIHEPVYDSALLGDFFTVNPPPVLKYGGKLYYFYSADRENLVKIPFMTNDEDNITNCFYEEIPPSEKNAYINEAPDPENGEENAPVPVEIGDKITYEIDVFNTTSGDTGPYDIVFALDWSGSMSNSSLMYLSDDEEDMSSITAKFFCRDLLLELSRDVFDIYPDSRISVMGLNTGILEEPIPSYIMVGGNNSNNPDALFLQVDTPFVGKADYVATIENAFAWDKEEDGVYVDRLSYFNSDDNAQFLAAAVDKMIGDDTKPYGSDCPPNPEGYYNSYPGNEGYLTNGDFDPSRLPGDGPYHVNARAPGDMDRTPVIVLLSDFQINFYDEYGELTSSPMNVPDYWEVYMKDQSDRYYGACPDGVLMTVRIDHTQNSATWQSPTNREKMETYVSPAGHDKWAFEVIEARTGYTNAHQLLLENLIEKAVPPTVVTDVVPLGLDIDLGSISPSYGVYDPDTRTVTWSLVDEPAEPITLSFDTTVAEAGLFENTAYVNEEPTNTTYHKAKLIIDGCLLLLDKSSDVDAPIGSGTCDVGDTVTYHVHVENAGNLDALGVIFTDQLAPGMDYVPDTAKIDNVPVPSGNVDYTDDGSIRTLTIDLGTIPVNGSCDVSFQVLVNGDEIAESETLKYLNQAVVTYHSLEDPEESASYSNVHEIGLELRPYRGTITDCLPEGLTITGHDDGGADDYDWEPGDRTVTWTWDVMPVGTTTVRVRVEVTEARELYKNQAFFTIEDEPPVPTNFTYHTCQMELILHIRQVVLSPLSGLPRPVMGYYTLSNEGNTLPLTSDSVTLGHPFTDYTLIPGDVKLYMLADVVPQYYEFAGHIQNDGDDPIDHRPEVPGATIDLTANGEIELDYDETGEIWITLYITPKGSPGNHQTGVESNKFGKVYTLPTPSIVIM